MKKIVLSLAFAIMMVFALSQIGFAQDYTEGGKYTRSGAIAAGSESGEIAPFDGAKNLKCPDVYKKGDFLPDPYKDEKVLFRIDHTNVDKYKDRLTPGQAVRVKKNKFFYMNIYPSHRNIEFPEEYYIATEKNLKSAHLDERNILKGYNGGLPFPFPKNGVEAIWNVKKIYWGDDLLMEECLRFVSPRGKIKRIEDESKMLFRDRRLFSEYPNPNGIAMEWITWYNYPPDQAGEAYLVKHYIDDSKKEDVWTYVPTLRRVRRAPTMSGGFQPEGESTADQVSWGYRGPINEYTWKLIGKKELYIVINPYSQWKLDATDEDELLVGDLNPEILRYELHRVWVVEGIPKQDVSHPYSKRLIYVDEDGWYPRADTSWDKRDNVWRAGEYYELYNYCAKHAIPYGEFFLNLDSGRYQVHGGCKRSDKDYFIPKSNLGLEANEFTVQTVRKLGR